MNDWNGVVKIGVCKEREWKERDERIDKKVDAPFQLDDEE
jgi:hypothetical protein